MEAGPEGAEPNTARFILYPADLVASQRAWWSMNVATWRRFAVIVAVLACLYTPSGLWLLRDKLSPAVVLIVGASALIGAGVGAAVMLLVSRIAAMRRGRGALAEQKTLVGEFVWTWTADALSIVHPNGEARLGWSLFHAWGEGPQSLLLLHSRLTFNAVPKRALPPGGADAIARYLRAAGVPERRPFGLIPSPLGR
jgi:hypothetical protein